ncbi:MAG: TspO/MBR family protein [archaeon]
MKNLLKLVASIVLVWIVGVSGSLFTASSINSWYSYLVKPSFNPPSWLFGPVWTILYIMIGVSLFLVWTTKANKILKRKAYWIFGIQLVLNAMWSVAFFGAHNPGLAFIVIVLLWISIILNIIEFYKIKKFTGYLLVPYFLWVSFAAVLNLAIYLLN